MKDVVNFDCDSVSDFPRPADLFQVNDRIMTIANGMKFVETLLKSIDLNEWKMEHSTTLLHFGLAMKIRTVQNKLLFQMCLARAFMTCEKRMKFTHPNTQRFIAVQSVIKSDLILSLYFSK